MGPATRDDPVIVWRPQAGPQHAFVKCPYFDCLFGGARGGGKSDACLGEFALHASHYGPGARGLFVRREMPQADSLIDRSHEIYAPLGAEWGEQKKQWVFPNGAVLRFRPLEGDRDAEKYQGQQFCVAVDTPIRMADGAFKPLSSINVGELVATLLGPRRVRAIVAPYVAECVRVLVRDASGVVLGEQVHPVWHPVLTSAGLISTHTEASRRSRGRSARAGFASNTRGAKFHSDAGRDNPAWFAYAVNAPSDCAVSESRRQERRRLVPSSVRVALHGPTARLKASSYLDCLGSPTEYHDPGTRCEWCCNQRRFRRRAQQHLLTDRVRPLARVRSVLGLAVQRLASAATCVPSGWQSVRDWLGYCRFACDFGGGLSRRAEEIGQAHILPPVDAAIRFRVWPLGVSDTTPRHSQRHPRSWVHPYTGAALHLAEEVQHGTMELLGGESALVADLCVEEANHYITDTGLINKNTRVYVEELTNYPEPRPVDKMKATLRSAGGVPVKFRATANPGGPGHNWVKQRYIDPHPLGYQAFADESGQRNRIYIPARVHDNRRLLASDPGYVERLKLSGSATLVKAWLDGDWSVIEGAYFDCWSNERHVIAPFEIPKLWTRFRAMDWGSAAPFAVYWVAVVSDPHDIGGRLLPRGSLVVYREWYGATGPNVGLKLTAEAVGRGIVEREAGDKVDYGVLDPAAFAQDGGPSIAERLVNAGAVFRPADNRRAGTLGHSGGWDQLRQRLVGDEDGKPMLYVFGTCKDLIRTLPVLQHDQNRPEDVDTDGEDHAADALRYGVMSRPWTRPAPQKPRPITKLSDVTLDQLYAAHERGNRKGRI